MKQSGIEFLLKLKDKLTAPLKNIQKIKDDLKKGITIDFKGFLIRSAHKIVSLPLINNK